MRASNFLLTLRLAVCLGLLSLAVPLAFGQTPCSNNNPLGQSAPPCECGDDETTGECQPAVGVNPINVYTGNVTREVPDLLVSGAVGDFPLRWRRTMTTRYRPTVATPMGDGGS